MAALHTIRTTIQPLDEITVDHEEYEYLLEQGLIWDGTPPDPVADPFDAHLAERLDDPDSTTRQVIDGLVTASITAYQDPFVSALVADPDSETAVELRATLVSRAPTAFLDASTLPNGSLTQLGTGQSVTLFGNSPALISGGKIVHNPSAGTNKAAYIQANLGSDVTEIGATVEFAAADAGSVAFVLPLAPWADGSLSNAGVHFVCQGDGAWHVSTWNGTTENPMYYAGRIGALNGTTARKFVVEIDRAASSLVIRFPDGTTSPTITHANIAALTSSYAVWELFEYDTALSTPVKLHAIWAAGTPARIDQAKPRYADLLKTIAANSVAMLPVAKTITAEPAGTTGNNVLTARVELGRVTIRRPPSGKVTADLHCFLGFKQRNIIAIAWFGYVAKDAASASGDYTKAWRLGDTTNVKTDDTTAADWTIEQSYAGQVELTIPAPAVNGASDLFDVICCITRVNGNDSDLKYRINDGAGQRAILKASPIA